MTERVANNFATTLNGAITNVAQSIVTNAAAPTALQNGEFRIIIDSEIMLVTAGQSSTTWTVTRAVESTSNASHSSGATVRHLLTAHALRVLKEELWLTDPRIDIQMNQTGVDQGPKLQQAIDLALTGDGCLRLNPGVVENRSVELAFIHTGKELFIDGCGNGANETSGSVIRYPVDLGAGKYAIKPGEGGAYPLTWRNFTLLGPGGGAAMGTNQAAMFGPRVAGRSFMDRVTVTRFHTGVVCPGDHHTWRDCDFAGNSFGLYFADSGTWGIGDVLVDRCTLTGCTKASIAIGTSYSLANFTFIHGHAGFSPIGIYRFLETGQPSYRTDFMLGGKFINFPFEACGDAVIYDEVGDGNISNVEFSSMGEAGASEFHWKNGILGLWHLGSVGSIHVSGVTSPFVIPGQGIDLPWIYAPNGIRNLSIDDGNYPAFNVAADSGHKLLSGGYIEKVSLGYLGAGGGRGFNGTVVNCAENVSRYDALELVDYNIQARKARNAYPYLGQALHDAAVGTSVFVATNGDAGTMVRGKLTNAVAASDMLVVDTANPGQLKFTSSFGYDVVARAAVPISGGATGQVKVTNSQAT